LGADLPRPTTSTDMNDYKFTDYFEQKVLLKRPYLNKEWCIRVLENPIKTEPQEHNRFRFWGMIEELDNRAGQSHQVIA
jgi:hypothetical protein